MYNRDLPNFLLHKPVNKMLLIESINKESNIKVSIKIDLKAKEITDIKEVNRNFKEATDKISTKDITEIQPTNFNNGTIIITKATHPINKIDLEVRDKVNKESIRMRDSRDSQNLTNNMIHTKIGPLVNSSLIILTKKEVIHLNKIQEPHKEEEINILKKHLSKQCKTI